MNPAALFMAPIFVYIEVLFKLGLLKKLRMEVEPEIRSRLKAFQQARKAAGATKAA